MHTITVITGFGYYTDTNGNIICKAQLEPGDHQIDDGLIYTEVPDQVTLDSIQIYVSPIPPLQAFSWSTFAIGLQVAFQPINDYVDILPFYAMVIDYARVLNFTGMNVFLQGLITDSLITQDHFDLLNGVAQQQNIDITNPPVGS